MSEQPPHPHSPENKGNELHPARQPAHEIHDSVLREKRDPLGQHQSPPSWIIGICFLIILAGGIYFGMNSGGFQPDIFEPNGISPKDRVGQKVDPIALGRKLYSINCSQCHQPSGLGIPNQYPPLAGSEIAQSQQGWGANHVVMIVVGGLSGPITIKGNSFNENMPAHRDRLKDEQIAAILTYIRQEWGNQADPIPTEAVAAIRAETESRIPAWTQAELKAIPAKDLPGAKAPEDVQPDKSTRPEK